MDLGTAADWAGVVISFGIGVTAGWLAHRTNQHARAANAIGDATRELAEAANQIAARSNVLAAASNSVAEAVAKMEARRDEEANEIRESERCMILMAMSGSIVMASAAAAEAVRLLPWADAQGTIGSKDVVVQKLFEGAYEVPDAVLTRIHYLERSTAARIVRSARLIQMLKNRYDSHGMHDISANFPTVEGVIREVHSDLEMVYQETMNAIDAAGLQSVEVVTG